jgi:hypothetical protein
VVLRASARKEFEQAREEPARPAASARPTDRARASPPIAQDPLLVARMLVVGRECLDRTVRQFEEAQHRIQSKVENTRTR